MEKESSASNRRHEFDWIRVMAILIVFLYHSTRFFNLEAWHIKNIDTYVWVEIWNYFATLWMMPIFFIVSGISLFYVLRKKTGWKQFYTDKFIRLMIPLIFGAFTHSALQIYLERITHNQFSGSFFSFFPSYFSGLYLEIGGTGNFAFHGMHLWYLLFLFLFSILCYGLFKWLMGSANRLLVRFTNLITNSILMYMIFPFVLLSIKLVIPASILNAGSGGWGFIYYLCFLIAGFVIASSPELSLKIKNKCHLSLLIAVILTIIYLYQSFSRSYIIFPVEISPFLYSFLRYVCSWTWLLTITGFGMRYLSFDHPSLKHLNEGIMPFYVLHQTVLLCVGYFVMPTGIHDFIKWGLVFCGSFLIIIAIYMVFIRKIDLFRFLFGMKTSHPFYEILHRRNALAIPHLIFIGLIIFSVTNSSIAVLISEKPGPVIYNKSKDIILNISSAAKLSTTGVQIVNDRNAAEGKVIAFATEAVPKPLKDPKIYADIDFFAPAGSYVIWLRGKCKSDDLYADSVWLQFDRQVGTGRGRMFGNWANIHPAHNWGWASDGAHAVNVILKYTGDHRIRIQPRQIPHKIDQIWLSWFQYSVPDDNSPIE